MLNLDGIRYALVTVWDSEQSFTGPPSSERVDHPLSIRVLEQGRELFGSSISLNLHPL